MRLHEYAPRPTQIKWLLDSDPAIRWQVMRDLTGEAPNAIAAERSRVATEGWGAQLLALQSPAGNWGGPKWDLITLYSLVVLKDLGLDPAGKEARKTIDRVDKRLVFAWLNNRPYLHGETEPCINGRILGIGSYFKEPNDALAHELLGEQLEDGGWNCEAHKKAGDLRSIPPSACSKDCSNPNEQGANLRPSPGPASGPKTICSSAGMFRSLRTGEVIDKRRLPFSFPTFWHYDQVESCERPTAPKGARWRPETPPADHGPAPRGLRHSDYNGRGLLCDFTDLHSSYARWRGGTPPRNRRGRPPRKCKAPGWTKPCRPTSAPICSSRR